ncbi:MAG: DUF3854 domain-containing protein, partial [Acidobacteria bacterium]|nr:DUF3854 domain-containing protein [Acidobacteriota bacterium]
MNLTEADLTKFAASFIKAELLGRAEVRRVSSDEGKTICGWRNKDKDYSGIIFTYRLPESEQVRVLRLRLDKPDVKLDADGKPKLDREGKPKLEHKYLSPKLSDNLFYFTPATKAVWLDDVSLDVVITEGEKKTIALERLALYEREPNRPRFLPVGLSGVWNFQQKPRSSDGAKDDKAQSKPIADLKLIKWRGRRVFILYDANAATNEDVFAARARLTKLLMQRGASEVLFVTLPRISGVNGVDDYLGQIEAKHGTAAAIEAGVTLLESALPSRLFPARLDGASDADGNKATVTKRVSFAELADGRLIEQTTKGFAVYDEATGEIDFALQVEADGVLYEPLQISFDKRGAAIVGLPSDVHEYNTEVELDAEIENYLHRHIDLPEVERKLIVQYVKLSYLTDKLEEISYLRAFGGRGNGKSRFIQAVGLLCYRPLFCISITAAALFRIMDEYKPTLVIDEANLNTDSDDTQAVMQILNTGYQRLGTIPRVEGNNGSRRIEHFDAFGAKILASLKTFDSAAFESRCIRVQMQKTTRNDIKFRLSKALKTEAETLRSKLVLWKLRNYNRDFEAALDEAETALKKANIEPRYVQIGIPLYTMLTDAKLKRDFAAMLKSRDDADAATRQQTFDGELVAIIHALVCEQDGETWRLKSAFADDEPCEMLSIKAITAALNKDLPEKEHHKSNYVSREVG